MDRRNFMRSLIGGVAATAAVRAWPFRVYSFPSQPKLIQFGDGIGFREDAAVVYAAMQQRLANPPCFPPFSLVKPGSEVVYLGFDKKIHIYDYSEPMYG